MTFACEIKEKYSDFLECFDILIANTNPQFRGFLSLLVYLIKDRFCFYLLLNNVNR